MPKHSGWNRSETSSCQTLVKRKRRHMQPAPLIVILLALITSLTASQVTTLSPNLKWWPTSGTVILLGGGVADDTAEVFENRLIALAGGPDALIVVIPTASDGLPAEL